MQFQLTSFNQEQHKFDFPAAFYRTLTVILPGKQITLDFQTGQVYDRPTEEQEVLATSLVVDSFLQHLKKQNRAKSTIASYRSVLNALAEYAPEWPPVPDELDAWLDEYGERGCSRVTLAEYWSWTNTWFKWALQKGYIDVNPMNMVVRREKPQIEATVIHPQDFVKVINYLRTVIANSQPQQQWLPYERAVRDLAIIRFAYATGCRRGEVAGLLLRDLYLGENKAIVRYQTSKSKKTRDFFFGRQAKHSLEAWLKIRPEGGDQLFLGTQGNGWSRKAFTPAGIYQAWRERQKEAEIGPYKFHEIRHSHITHSMDNGIPIHHISSQAGHSKPDITLRIYTHSQDPERKEAYNGKNPDDTLEN